MYNSIEIKWSFVEPCKLASPFESHDSCGSCCTDQFVWLGHVVLFTPVEATWLGYREAAILVTCSKTCSPQASGGPSLQARFIAWHLRYPFSGGCRRWPRHFWSQRVYLGYGPAPKPILKRPRAALVQLVGRTTNTVGEPHLNK